MSFHVSSRKVIENNVFNVDNTNADWKGYEIDNTNVDFFFSKAIVDFFKWNWYWTTLFFISPYSFTFGVKGQKLTQSILFYQNPHKLSVQIHNVINIFILTNFAKHTSSFLGKFMGTIILFHCNFWLNLQCLTKSCP